MSATPKTIQIFLPGGDPRGIRVAEITTRIVQVIEVPRKLLPEFFKLPESKQVALYFLVGESEDEQQDQVYIGQTGDLKARLSDHNKKKDFWQRALVLISRTNTLTQTHALFLEWQSIQAAKEAGRYLVENVNAGTKPHTPAPMEAECMEVFETGQTLLATLGYPVFDSLTAIKPKKQDLFYCKGRNSDAIMQYTEEGFVVLKGSKGRLKHVNSLDTSYARLRKKFLETGVTVSDGDQVIYQKDHLFSSPSAAAAAVTGRPENGWTAWKDSQGRTLDEVKRQSGGGSR
ncbi:MAG: GIY-YIG nuclease family protein [Planctomycetota bacterium]